jgi:hypothetical protein
VAGFVHKADCQLGAKGAANAAIRDQLQDRPKSTLMTAGGAVPQAVPIRS